MNKTENIKNKTSQTVENSRLETFVRLPELKPNDIYYGDSFELCERVPDKTVDLILEDMPYNTTACEWDVKIDLELYWKTRLRILKSTGAVVLTGSQPFTTKLVMSNRKMFKYEWIWDKKTSTGGATANKRPMKAHENILIFNNGPYHPQMDQWPDEGIKRMSKKRYDAKPKTELMYGKHLVCNKEDKLARGKYPQSVIRINGIGRTDKEGGLHPTQKPVGLFEYLIRTYTNEGDLVFDGFGGSGTTAIAAHKSNRNFIVIEKEEKYYELAKKRLDSERAQLKMF